MLGGLQLCKSCTIPETSLYLDLLADVIMTVLKPVLYSQHITRVHIYLYLYKDIGPIQPVWMDLTVVTLAVVDNLPKVPQEKYDRLSAVLRKVYGQIATVREGAGATCAELCRPCLRLSKSVAFRVTEYTQHENHMSLQVACGCRAPITSLWALPLLSSQRQR